MSEQIIPVEQPIQSPEQLSLPMEIMVDEAIPPKTITRNKYGLIEGLKYKFNEDGLVDWKGMVDPKFLYLNPEMKRRGKIESKYGKKFEDIKVFDDKVDDTDLVISLGGIRQLLHLRGYSSLNNTIHDANDHYASVNCSIYFLPNYENEGIEMRFSDNACAHFDNTNSFGRSYLVEIASNRAMCRCVRGFLRVGIVSTEELGGANSPSEPVEDPTVALLKGTMAEHGVTWEKIKAKLIEEKVEGAENYNGVQDMSKLLQFSFVERIKKAVEKK